MDGRSLAVGVMVLALASMICTAEGVENVWSDAEAVVPEIAPQYNNLYTIGKAKTAVEHVIATRRAHDVTIKSEDVLIQTLNDPPPAEKIDPQGALNANNVVDKNAPTGMLGGDPKAAAAVAVAAAAGGNSTAADAADTAVVKEAADAAVKETDAKKAAAPAHDSKDDDKDDTDDLGVPKPIEVPKVYIPSPQQVKKQIAAATPPALHSKSYWKLKKLKDEQRFARQSQHMSEDQLKHKLSRHYASRLMKDHMKRKIDRLRRQHALESQGPSAYYKPFDWGEYDEPSDDKTSDDDSSPATPAPAEIVGSPP